MGIITDYEELKNDSRRIKTSGKTGQDLRLLNKKKQVLLRLLSLLCFCAYGYTSIPALDIVQPVFVENINSTTNSCLLYLVKLVNISII